MELNMVVESKTRKRPQVVQDNDGPLLAAAIAAALVEYRRYTGQRMEREDLKSTRTNWRMMVRLEQLRGRG